MDQRYAATRLTLGLLQIIGATSGLSLLVVSGLSPLTFGTAVITAVITVLSRMLFARWRLPS